MTWFPRRRSLLASFSLTGILLVIILIHKQSDNFQSETVFKSSELQSDFVSEFGSSSTSEASRNTQRFDSSNVKYEQSLGVGEQGVLLFREYTIYNDQAKENDLAIKEKVFPITEKSLAEEPALILNGEDTFEKETSKKMFSEVEPLGQKETLKGSDNKQINFDSKQINFDNKQINFIAATNLEDNKNEIKNHQILIKPFIDNSEILKSSIKKDEQSRSQLELQPTVNNGNKKLEIADKSKRKILRTVVNHVEDKIQETNTKNDEEKTISKVLKETNKLTKNSVKNEVKNDKKIFENLSLSNFIFELKSNKSRDTIDTSKTVEFSKNNSSNSTRSIKSSSKSNISNNISSISVRSPKSESRSLNLTSTKYVNKKQNLMRNESLSRKINKAAKVPTYKQVFKQLIALNKMYIKKLFSKEPKDIDFTPGERVPSDKVSRVLIVSTWRSGSTFLGDIFNSYPAAFYSFEPLHMKYRNKHLQKGEDIDEALSFIKDIFTCNISYHQEYMKYLQEYKYVLIHNKFMWNSCYANRAYCFDSNFMTEICQHAPLNIMKTVRLGLLPIEKLLKDQTLNLKVIHLVRDPRGSLHSRVKLDWCTSKICRDPKTVCDSLYADMKLSDLYLKKYPEKFLVVRYEDLSLNPKNVSQNILQFVGLHFHQGTQNFLKEHTELQDSNKSYKKIGTYTTFRDSQKIPFRWRDSFSFPQNNYIQKMCKNTLDVLGYRIFHTQAEYKNKNISVLINS